MTKIMWQLWALDGIHLLAYFIFLASYIIEKRVYLLEKSIEIECKPLIRIKDEGGGKRPTFVRVPLKIPTFFDFLWYRTGGTSVLHFLRI